MPYLNTVYRLSLFMSASYHGARTKFKTILWSFLLIYQLYTLSRPEILIDFQPEINQLVRFRQFFSWWTHWYKLIEFVMLFSYNQIDISRKYFFLILLEFEPASWPWLTGWSTDKCKLEVLRECVCCASLIWGERKKGVSFFDYVTCRVRVFGK